MWGLCLGGASSRILEMDINQRLPQIKHPFMTVVVAVKGKRNIVGLDVQRGVC